MKKMIFYFGLIFVISYPFELLALTLENDNYRVVTTEDWIDSHPPGSLVEFSSFSEPIGDILEGMAFAGMVYADGYKPAPGTATQYSSTEGVFSSLYLEKDSYPDLPVRTTFYYTLQDNGLHISWRVDADEVVEFEYGVVWSWKITSWDQLDGYNHVGHVDDYDLSETISGALIKALRSAWKLSKPGGALWIVQPDPFQARWQIKNDYLEQEWLQSRPPVTTFPVSEFPRICSALSPEHSIWGEVQLCISSPDDETPFGDTGYMMLSGMPNAADQGLALMWDEAPIPGDYFNPMTTPSNPNTPYGGKIVQLLENHPAMKNVLLLAVDKILGYYPFKPSIPYWWTPENFVSVDTLEQLEGEGALTVSHYELGTSWVQQTFTCEPNEILQVTGWVRIDSLSSGRAGILFTGDAPVASTLNLIFTDPISWTFINAEINTGNNTELVINVGIDGGTGKAWFDDIIVERISVPGNLLGNGGFNDFTFPVWWDGEGPEWCHFHGNLHMPTMATEEYKDWFNMLEDGGTTVYGWEDRMSTGVHCYHHTPNELNMLGGDDVHEFNFYNPAFDSATFGMVNRDLESCGLSSLTMRTARFAGFKHHLPTVIEAIKSGTVFLDRGWTTSGSGTCLLGTIIRPEGVVWESNTNWWLDYETWSGNNIAMSNLSRGEFVLAGGHPGSTFSLDHPEHFDVVDGAFDEIEATFPNLIYLFPHDYAYMCEESRHWWGVQYEETDEAYQLIFFGSAQNGQTIVQSLADGQTVGLPPLVDGTSVDFIERGDRIFILLPELELGFHIVEVYKNGTYVSPNTAPHSFQLKRPYPNPCNSWVTFPFELSHPAAVELTIMDVLGRQVYRNKSSYLSGARKLSLDIDELTSGTYFYRIKVDKEVQVGKITILK